MIPMTPENRKRRAERRSATPEDLRRYGILGCHERGLLPRIAGGDEAATAEPTPLEEAMASLEASLKSAESANGDESAAGDESAEEPTPEQKALDARATELKAIEERLTKGIQSFTTLVENLKKPGGSRFVGEGADPAVAAVVAAGGSVEKGTGLTIAEPASVKAGEHLGAKAIHDSKSVARFFGALKAVRENYATDAEREFMGRQKALAEATGSAGGYLIPPDWMPGILQLFRGVTVVRRARPGRIVPFTAQMNQVALTGGATAYYTAENAAIPTSQETLGQVTLLTPHNLTGMVPASNWLLQDSRRTDVPNQVNVDAEQAIRQDLAVVMALKEDKNFLFGNPGTETGSPTGLVNIAGIVTNPLSVPANGFQPTLPQLRALKNYVRRFNVPNARWTWFFHSEFISYVEGLTDSLGRFLADAPNLLQVNDDDNAGANDDPASSGSIVGAGAGWTGRLLNLPFFASNQIPVNLTQGTASNATWALLVDMNQLVVGLNQDLVIETSSEASYTTDGGTTWVSAFQSNQTLFKATLRHDVNHLYPSLGVVQQSGILVS